jgi:Putative NADH-flavin reductase
MKVVIFGANGKTGLHLVDQALEAGHEVVAYIRKAGSIKFQKNLKIIVGNLNETLKLKDAIAGADACISTLGGGSLTHHSPEIKQGIENIISAMEQLNVPKFIYMSSIGAGESRFLMSQPFRFLIFNLMLSVPLDDHNSNEEKIFNSKLNWTIVRPGSLTDGAKTGNLQHGTQIKPMKGNRRISRANVAAFMLQQLIDDKYSKKAVWLYE